MNVRLVPLTLAFFSGRLVAYSLYVGGATVASDTLEEVISDSLGSPLGIAAQVLLLAGLVALVRVDWVSVLRRRDRDAGRPSISELTT